VPETIDLARLLETLRIDREGLIDLALMVGTDFNEGVKGIGPKKALKLVQQYGRIERMPPEIRDSMGEAALVDDVRRIYMQPDVTDDFTVAAVDPDLYGIVRFLCDEREFGRDRVTAALDRRTGRGRWAHSRRSQAVGSASSQPEHNSMALKSKASLIDPSHH
jgi:flap endonuclease-1